MDGLEGLERDFWADARRVAQRYADGRHLCLTE
jgi:hypothetical protein